MPTQRKIDQVADLTDKLGRSQLTIVTDYRGLTVADMQNLRRQLRPLGAEMLVAKNTLTLRAAQATGQPAIEPALAGPTALVFVYDNVAGAAKTVSDFARTSRILTVRAGLMGNSLVGPDDVTALATLPPKSQLQAELLGALVGPVTGVVSIFNSVAQSVVSILDQRAQQLGGDAGAADAGA